MKNKNLPDDLPIKRAPWHKRLRTARRRYRNPEIDQTLVQLDEEYANLAASSSPEVPSHLKEAIMNQTEDLPQQKVRAKAERASARGGVFLIARPMWQIVLFALLVWSFLYSFKSRRK